MPVAQAGAHAHHSIDSQIETARSQGPGRLLCALIAVSFVTLLFGDVVFRGGSLSPLDLEDALARPGAAPKTVSLLPERPGRSPLDGWGDTGSAAWQMQPAQGFMAYAIRHHESPYWDPFAGAGMMGPETLEDLKFSPITIMSALLGGRSAAFTFVLLLEYVCALYALLRVITGYFQLSIWAGVAGCTAFMLNGFVFANLNTAIGQPYFVAPIALWGLLAFFQKPSPRRLAAAVLADAALFSVTFAPTLVLVTIVVHSAALLWAWFWAETPQRRPLAWIAAISLGAVLLLGFLYGPILEAYVGFTDDWSAYAGRITAGTSLENLLSLFTPKHFWEVGRAMQIPASWEPGHYDRWVCALGIIPILIAAQAFSRNRKPLHLVMALLFALLVAISAGQTFGIAPFSYIDHLPFFSFVRNEYWPAMTSLALSLLVPFGFDNLRKTTALNIFFLLAAAVIACSFFFLLGKLGMPENPNARFDVEAFLLIFAGAVTCFVLVALTSRAASLKMFLAIAMIGEGVFYLNTLHRIRTGRDERLPETLAWVKDRIRSPGGDRILNIGRSGIFPNWGSALQMPSTETLNMASLPSYRSFFGEHVGRGVFLSLADPENEPTFTAGSLSVLGIRYVIAGREMTTAVGRLRAFGYPVVKEDAVRIVFENPSPAPRAFVAAGLANSAGWPSASGPLAWKVATSSDARLLAEASTLGIQAGQSSPGDTQNASVIIRDYHNARLRLDATLKRPGLLVLMDSWHPNWRATVDGKPAYIGQVDMAFRGMALGAGSHEIDFTYEPRTLRFGIAASAMTAAALLALLIVPFRNRQWWSAAGL